MVRSEIDDDPLTLGWAVFWMKIAGALVWLAADVLAAVVSVSSYIGAWERATASVGLMIAALVWHRLSIRKLKRSDEFNRNLLVLELRSGTQWIVLFGTLFVACMTAESALTRVQGDMTRVGYVMLLMQPPLAVLYGASMAQFARWRYARNGRT